MQLRNSCPFCTNESRFQPEGDNHEAYQTLAEAAVQIPLTAEDMAANLAEQQAAAEREDEDRVGREHWVYTYPHFLEIAMLDAGYELGPGPLPLGGEWLEDAVWEMVRESHGLPPEHDGDNPNDMDYEEELETDMESEGYLSEEEEVMEVEEEVEVMEEEVEVREWVPIAGSIELPDVDPLILQQLQVQLAGQPLTNYNEEPMEQEAIQWVDEVETDMESEEELAAGEAVDWFNQWDGELPAESDDDDDVQIVWSSM